MVKSIFFNKYGAYFKGDDGKTVSLRFRSQQTTEAKTKEDGTQTKPRPYIVRGVLEQKSSKGTYYIVVDGKEHPEAKKSKLFFDDNGLHFIGEDGKSVHARLPFEKKSKPTDKHKFGSTYIVRDVKEVQKDGKTYYNFDEYGRDFKPTKKKDNLQR